MMDERMRALCGTATGVDYSKVDSSLLNELDMAFTEHYRDKMDWTFKDTARVRSVWQEYSEACRIAFQKPRPAEMKSKTATHFRPLTTRPNVDSINIGLEYKVDGVNLPLLTGSVMLHIVKGFKSVDKALFEVSVLDSLPFRFARMRGLACARMNGRSPKGWSPARINGRPPARTRGLAFARAPR
jgi:hypothetical protein